MLQRWASQKVFFLSRRKKLCSTVDVLIESREGEPVLQQCNVATNNRKWNDTSSQPLPYSTWTLIVRFSFSRRSKSGKIEADVLLTRVSSLCGERREMVKCKGGGGGVVEGVCSLKGVMVTAFGAVCFSRTRLHLLSHASCQESTHWSISICLCVSPWPSPLPQVEKNGGVHHPEWVTEWGRERKEGGGLCTCATESRRKEWAMSLETTSSQPPSNHRRCSYGLTLRPPCQAFFLFTLPQL